MSQTLYLNWNTAIINFNQGYPNNSQEILNSNSFKQLVDGYLEQAPRSVMRDLKELCKENNLRESIIELARHLYVYKLEDIDHPLMANPKLVSRLVEEIYVYWREFQRCSIVHLGKKSKSELINFIDADTQFNNTILRFYRLLQEKVQGRKNKIYRQLKSGTNAAITLIEKQNLVPEDYTEFRKLHFVDSVLLHSPLILHPKTNKREGHFQETNTNPIKGLELRKDEFYC